MNQPSITHSDNKREGRTVGRLFTAAWVVNAMLLVASIGWIFLDGRSHDTIVELGRAVGLPQTTSGLRPPAVRGGTIAVLQGAIAVAAVTLGAMLGSLFFGGRRFRALRFWLLFTSVVAGWLGLIFGWSNIHWLGQTSRVRAALPAIALTAEHLASNWPQNDGELPVIGNFLAYPKGAPRTLLPLGAASFPGTRLSFSAVERSADGVIRFELSGREAGVWVERRPLGSDTTAFEGGLKTRYRVVRRERIAPGWYLVRYGVE